MQSNTYTHVSEALLLPFGCLNMGLYFHVCTDVPVSNMWQSGVNLNLTVSFPRSCWHYILSHSLLLLYGAHQFSQADWHTNPRDQLVPISPGHGLQKHATVTGFYTCALGTELRSFCLCNQQLSDWSISLEHLPALIPMASAVLDFVWLWVGNWPLYLSPLKPAKVSGPTLCYQSLNFVFFLPTFYPSFSMGFQTTPRSNLVHFIIIMGRWNNLLAIR